jgi:charged multivesicular body protein 1
MDTFERQFEDLDVQTSYMESAMSQTTAQATPQDEVDELMQRVADEHGLELKMDLPGVSLGAEKEKEKETSKEEDELGARLAKLRNASS